MKYYFNILRMINSPQHGVKITAVLLFVFMQFNIPFTLAQEAQLQVKPGRCISLHEGQVCYQKLIIQWQSLIADNYCLYQKSNPVALLCWDNVAQGSGAYEFSGSMSTDFILVRKRDEHILAEFKIDVVWVYDASSRRESHWKIF